MDVSLNRQWDNTVSRTYATQSFINFIDMNHCFFVHYFSTVIIRTGLSSLTTTPLHQRIVNERFQDADEDTYAKLAIGWKVTKEYCSQLQFIQVPKGPLNLSSPR